MTVVAGCLTVDGVLIGGDCRVTWTLGGKPLITDDAAKLIRIGPSCLLGYSGHIPTVGWLVGELHRQLKRKRQDAVSLTHWLPRFFRRTYRALARTVEIGPVAFLVGGTIPGREATITYEAVQSALERTSPRDMNNWLMMRLMPEIPHRTESFRRPDGSVQILYVTSARAEDVFAVPNSSAGVLYKMESPLFAPQFSDILGALAIGSGADAAQALEAYQPVLMCGDPDRAQGLFIDAMINYLGDTRAPGVGGMLLASMLRNGAVKSLSFSSHTKDGGTLSIRTESNRFVVVDTKGRRVPLRWPLEITSKSPSMPLVVNDLYKVERSDLPVILRTPAVKHERFELSAAEREFMFQCLREITKIREALRSAEIADEVACEQLQKVGDDIYHLLVGLPPATQVSRADDTAR